MAYVTFLRPEVTFINGLLLRLPVTRHVRLLIRGIDKTFQLCATSASFMVLQRPLKWKEAHTMNKDDHVLSAHVVLVARLC